MEAGPRAKGRREGWAGGFQRGKAGRRGGRGSAADLHVTVGFGAHGPVKHLGLAGEGSRSCLNLSALPRESDGSGPKRGKARASGAG